MDDLIARIRRMGVLVLIGVLLILYIALGFIYLQQGAKQEDLNEQIAKVSVIVSKPLPSARELEQEYDEMNRNLAPRAVPEVLEAIVNIARENGINVDPDDGKFHIPPPGNPSQQKVGASNYLVLSVSNIKLQGEHENVMAFIADLDSGSTMKNMVLKKVDIHQVEVRYGGEEAARRTEFRGVATAVIDLMAANDLTEIPNPKDYDGGVATNYMGDDPETEEVFEGFPDTATTAAEKGYTGDGTPKDGYLLYQHDIISTDNTIEYETVNYFPELTTRYYYTCEKDGTVRQFGGTDVTAATEYFGSEETRMETVATLNVVLYTKPEAAEEPAKGG